MYRATMERVEREVYTRPADWQFKSLLRWVGHDPDYKRRMGLLLVRDIDPTRWLPGWVMYRAILRGALGDLGRMLTRRPRPNALPPVRVARAL